MSIPNDSDIQIELLYLLSTAHNGTMHCNYVYDELAKSFPQLTTDEMKVPYQNSKSLWANRVQFARLHCVMNGWIFSEVEGFGRGLWTITKEGRRILET